MTRTPRQGSSLRRRLDWRTLPLFPKIGIAVTVLLLTTIAALTALWIDREQSAYARDLELRAHVLSGALAISLQDSLYFLESEEMVKNAERQVGIGLVESVRVYDSTGRVLVATDDDSLRHTLAADPVGARIARLEDVAFEWTPDRLWVERPIDESGQRLGGIRLAISTAELHRKIAALRLQAAVAAAVALVVGIFFSALLSRAVTTPLTRLVAATGEIARGRLDREIEVAPGRSEAAILGTALENMRTQLQELYGDLEGQVQERTRELLASSRELEAKNAELERFAYTISHDLKSPLITIRAYADLIKRGIAEGKSDHIARDVEWIAGATETMNRMLTELLELSRIGRVVNPPQEVSLRELIDEAVQMVSGQLRQRSVDLSVAPDLPTVWVDRTRIVEVFENLLSNSIAALSEASQPRIEIGQLPEDETRELPAFFVRDNGKGIEPAFQESVFGLFQTLETSGEGTGIGLALVKRIVEVHQGEIWVESEGPGRGAAFCFTLPTEHHQLPTAPDAATA